MQPETVKNPTNVENNKKAFLSAKKTITFCDSCKKVQFERLKQLLYTINLASVCQLKLNTI